MTNEQTEERFEPSYRSGTAARLAGVPVETLRVWERRYGVVGPRTSPRGRRLYAAGDVSRLALIKQLVDLGSPIGTIANLPLAALREMRNAADAASKGRIGARNESVHPIRVALVGDTMTEDTGMDDARRTHLAIVARCPASAGAIEALRGVSADVVAIELPTLQADAVDFVDALAHTVGARRAVLAYRFGSTATVRQLRDRGHMVALAPLGPDELGLLCVDAAGFDAPRESAPLVPLPLDAVPVRRFDDVSLARIARASTKVNCECPHHLAELLVGLGAFERYSAECAQSNPGDAELHRYLRRVAGSARTMLEDALVRIARADGLPLPSNTVAKHFQD